MNKKEKILEIIGKDFSYSKRDWLSEDERKNKITHKLNNLSNSVKLIEKLGNLLDEMEKIVKEFNKNRIKWWNWKLNDFKRSFDFRIRDLNSLFITLNRHYNDLRDKILHLANIINSEDNNDN